MCEGSVKSVCTHTINTPGGVTMSIRSLEKTDSYPSTSLFTYIHVEIKEAAASMSWSNNFYVKSSITIYVA